eukprot:COSAG06_NODE_6476_length_2919_cov_4.193972_2_plen_90_part_00
MFKTSHHTGQKLELIACSAVQSATFSPGTARSSKFSSIELISPAGSKAGQGTPAVAETGAPVRVTDDDPHTHTTAAHIGTRTQHTHCAS